MSVVSNIKQLAKAQGITITHICKQINRGAWYLNDVEKGKSKISDHDLAIIADILNTTVEYLKKSSMKTDSSKKITFNSNQIVRAVLGSSSTNPQQLKKDLDSIDNSKKASKERQKLHRLIDNLPPERRQEALTYLQYLIDTSKNNQ